MSLGQAELVEMLRKMILIREFDELAIQLRTAGKIYGTMHPYVGQEAVAVGVCSALRVTDRVTSTHRGHGHCIAKGADIKRMMAELFGRVDGYCKGKGGSMHIADFAVGMLGANGIVGGGLPIAAGAALAMVLAFAVAGFSWWEAFPVLRERYWDGVASDRPMTYWWWGNLAALAICAGPLVGAGLAMLRRSTDRTVLLLVGAAVLMVALADASRMSKSEVERIWLPFVPWLTVSVALLPERWRRWGFGLQVATALAVQHLLYTSW